MRRLALLGGWLLVVILATVLTWQVVGVADDRVSDRPASPLNVSAPVTSAPTSTTTLPPTTSTTSSTSTSSTTPVNPPTTVTTTPQPPPTTTTTTVTWQVKSTSTAGGTVVIKYRPGEVILKAASPAAGFRADVDNAGPPEVELEFESEDLEVRFQAKWDDGQLEIEVKESEE